MLPAVAPESTLQVSSKYVDMLRLSKALRVEGLDPPGLFGLLFNQLSAVLLLPEALLDAGDDQPGLLGLLFTL